MTIYIKLLPGGTFKTGKVNGNAEIYDSVNKIIKKGYFVKSKLNGNDCGVIDYEPETSILLSIKGPFVNDMANGTVTKIEYLGDIPLQDILTNNLSVVCVKTLCTYLNGVLQSEVLLGSISISIDYTLHPTASGYTNFVLNEI